jgi:hypothetical protein
MTTKRLRPKRRKLTAKAPATGKAVITATATIVKRELPSGGHKWTVKSGDMVFSSSTTSSSVLTMAEISKKFAPALKRLAKE